MSPLRNPRAEYEPPNPHSRRCRMGLHVPTVVPRDTLASLAKAGVYKPGRLAADSCPWPGGYYGTPTFKWCTRCGAELEPEKVAAARARARETLDRIIREVARGNAMSDITRGSLTAEQVAEYTDALTRHYGERVAPVSNVCGAMDAYVHALRESGEDGPFPAATAEAIREHGPTMIMWARKSNLLWRLIYAGLPLRTTPCPEHKGHWSGCDRPGTCDCQVGTDITGWLP